MSAPNKELEAAREQARTTLRTIGVVFFRSARAETEPMLERIRAIPHVEAAGWIDQSDLDDDSPPLPDGGVLGVRVDNSHNMRAVTDEIADLPVPKMIQYLFDWQPK